VTRTTFPNERERERERESERERASERASERERGGHGESNTFSYRSTIYKDSYMNRFTIHYIVNLYKMNIIHQRIIFIVSSSMNDIHLISNNS